MARMSLGKTPIETSPLGLGVMTWGDPNEVPRFNPARLSYGLSESKDEQVKAVEVSISSGVTLFDTAAMYGAGASERRLGEITRDRNVLIATKFPMSFWATSGQLPTALDESLQRLGRSTIDLYQIHFPVPFRPIPRLMSLLAEAVKAGKVKTVGVSNFSAAQMRLAHAELAKFGIPLASNQVQYSLLYRKPEIDGVLDACRELGITLIAYMPLASGALTGKYTLANRPRGFRRFMSFFSKKNLATVEKVVSLLKEIGQRYGKGPGQVALRWLIEQGGVLPIPGAKNAEQAQYNAGALAFSLSKEEIEALSSATSQYRR